MTTRKRYSKEFKLDAVSLITEQHYTRAEAARSHNAVVESFFGSLKQERVQWANYQTRYEAQQDVLNYITMFYNRFRLHSYLGYISPNDFEHQWVTMKNVA